MELEDRSRLLNATPARAALKNMRLLFTQSSAYGQDIREKVLTRDAPEQADEKRWMQEHKAHMAFVGMMMDIGHPDTAQDNGNADMVKKLSHDDIAESFKGLGFLYTEHVMPLFTHDNIMRNNHYASTIHFMESFLKQVEVIEPDRPSVIRHDRLVKDKAADLIPLFMNTCAQCMNGDMDISRFVPDKDVAFQAFRDTTPTLTLNSAHKGPAAEPQDAPKEGKIRTLNWGGPKNP